jgi:prepilin signal peptidase PulO-like enzyme (type II secretory pathway)
MSIAFPLLAGSAGAAGGWFVSWVVDRTTPDRARKTKRLESILSTAASAALLFALAVRFKEPGVRLLVYGGLILALVGVALFDIRTQTIPNVVTIPGTVVGLISGSFVLPSGIRESILGLVIGGAALLAATIIERIRRKEIGGGDWKYAAMIGSFIGPKRIVIALILTGVFGILGAVVLIVSGRHAKPRALGPWLSAGAVASILLG